jgi:hypothetical protein
MNIRTTASALGLFIALGTPVATLAGDVTRPLYDEFGDHFATPPYGTTTNTAPLAAVSGAQVGDISADGQYVFLGEASGWQIRPMQFRIENGRLAHVDDPAGHMDRLADARPLTAQELATRQSSAGH